MALYDQFKQTKTKPTPAPVVDDPVSGEPMVNTKTNFSMYERYQAKLQGQELPESSSFMSTYAKVQPERPTFSPTPATERIGSKEYKDERGITAMASGRDLMEGKKIPDGPMSYAPGKKPTLMQRTGTTMKRDLEKGVGFWLEQGGKLRSWQREREYRSRIGIWRPEMYDEYTNENTTPERKIEIERAFDENVPLTRILNTPTGQKVVTTVADSTSNLGVKSIAAVRSIGKETYDEAYAAVLDERNDPTNPKWQQYLWEMQDSGIQSGIGFALGLATYRLTGSAAASVAVTTPYYAALSADEQIKETGRVYSPGNIAIDTIGDQVINNIFLGWTTAPKSVIARVLMQSQVEGATEVTQSALKYLNNYDNAKTDEERAAVVDDWNNYVKNEMVMEYLVGATMGGILSGGVEISSLNANQRVQAEQGIDQIANQLDDISPGLGEQFKSKLDIESATQEDIKAAGMEVLAEYRLTQDNNQYVSKNEANRARAEALKKKAKASSPSTIEQVREAQQRQNDQFVYNGERIDIFETPSGQFTFAGFNIPVELTKLVENPTQPNQRVPLSFDTRQEAESTFRSYVDRTAPSPAPEVAPGQQVPEDPTGLDMLSTPKENVRMTSQELPQQKNKPILPPSMETLRKDEQEGVRAASEGMAVDSGDRNKQNKRPVVPQLEPGATITRRVDSTLLSKTRKKGPTWTIPDPIETVFGTFIQPPAYNKSAANSSRWDKMYDQVLIDEAIKQARARDSARGEGRIRGDSGTEVLFKGMKAGNLSPADYSQLNLFLFNNPDPATLTYESMKTQKDQVKDILQKKGEASIKEVAKETGIKEPNIRRILGVGTKEGTFERVAEGVYTLTKDGETLAYVETGDAVEALPRLAKEGFKADMVFLDIPYDTKAVKGGNRGVNYGLISVDDFKKVIAAVKEIARSEDTPVIHMYSNAKTGLKQMEQYNAVLPEAGYKLVGRGEYQKTYKDGSPVGFPTPHGFTITPPEGIIVFTQSGKLKKDLKNLNFKLVRPRGYQTEKPAQMLRELIEMTTEEGETVLDPFAGSGVAAEQAVATNRKSVAIEKNPEAVKKHILPRVEAALKEEIKKENEAKKAEWEAWKAENLKSPKWKGNSIEDTEAMVRSAGSDYDSKFKMVLHGTQTKKAANAIRKTGFKDESGGGVYVGAYEDVMDLYYAEGDDARVVGALVRPGAQPLRKLPHGRSVSNIINMKGETEETITTGELVGGDNRYERYAPADLFPLPADMLFESDAENYIAEVQEGTQESVRTVQYHGTTLQQSQEVTADEGVDALVDTLAEKYPNGVMLYHQTSSDSKKAIESSGFSGEEEVYFTLGAYEKERSTSGGNGAVVSMKIMPEDYKMLAPDRGTYSGESEGEQYISLVDAIKNDIGIPDVTLLQQDANRILKNGRSGGRIFEVLSRPRSQEKTGNGMFKERPVAVRKSDLMQWLRGEGGRIELTATEQIPGGFVLTKETDTSKTRLLSTALFGVNDELQLGDTVVLDKDLLKYKGTYFDMVENLGPHVAQRAATMAAHEERSGATPGDSTDNFIREDDGRFRVSYNNEHILKEDIEEVLGTNNGLYWDEERRAMFEQYILPQLKDLPAAAEGEQLIYYTESADYGYQYVNLELKEAFNYEIGPHTNVAIVKETDLYTVTDTEELSPEQVEAGIRLLKLGERRKPTPRPGDNTEAFRSDPVARMNDQLRPLEMPELVRLAQKMGGQVTAHKDTKEGRLGFHRGGQINITPELFADTEQATKTLAHEIGHLNDYMPDEVNSRGTLSNRIAGTRKILVANFDGSLKEGKVRSKIHKELKAMSYYWRPLTPAAKLDAKHMKYRNSSSELYADALSMLFVRPDLVDKMGPTFKSTFFEYLDSKPDFKSYYFDTQELLFKGQDAVSQQRHEDLLQGFLTAEELEKKKRKEQEDFNTNIWHHTRTMYDRHITAVERVALAKKAGRTIPRDADPVEMWRNYNYMGGQVKWYLESFVQPVMDTLTNNDITWEDFGAYLTYQRISIGDRQGLANPGGLTKKTAGDQLTMMKKRLGPRKYQALEVARLRFVDGIHTILEDAYIKGSLYTESMYNKMRENPAYAAFRTLSHIMDSEVTAQVHSQLGTFSDIQNPADVTIVKVVETIRALERNHARLGSINFMLEHEDLWPGEIRAADTVWSKDLGGRIPVEPKTGNLKLVKVLNKGKLAGFYVHPEIAELWETQGTGDLLQVNAALRWMNNHGPRALYITLSTGFQTMNAQRDFRRAWRNLYSSKPNQNMLYLGMKLAKEYIKAAPSAFRRSLGKPDETIRDLEKNYLLSTTFNQTLKGNDTEENITEELLHVYNIGGSTRNEKPSAWDKVLYPARKVIEAIQIMGDTIETIPKIAGYRIMRERGAGEQEAVSFVRTNVGSPDFRIRGKGYEWTNNILLFSNAIKEGIRSDSILASKPETRYRWWFHFAATDLVPKLAMFAALLGAFGDDLKDLFEGVSDYNMTNYDIIPLGYTEDGKTMYVRIPKDEVSRVLSAIVWKALTAADNEKPWNRDLTDVVSLLGGQVPAVTPVLSFPVTAYQFATGKNPYDSFRGRYVLTDDEQKAGGMYRLEPFLRWSWGELGGNTIMTVETREYPGEDDGLYQTLIKAPIIGNPIKRTIQISDYGITERLREVGETVESGNARRRIEEKALIKEYSDRIRSGEDKTAMQQAFIADIKSLRNTDSLPKADGTRLLKRLKIASLESPKYDEYVNAVQYQSSNASKMSVLKRINEDMNDEDYVELLRILKENGIISSPVYNSARAEKWEGVQ